MVKPVDVDERVLADTAAEPETHDLLGNGMCPSRVRYMLIVCARTTRGYGVCQSPRASNQQRHFITSNLAARVRSS
jgi:hypothetical protein